MIAVHAAKVALVAAVAHAPELMPRKRIDMDPAARGSQILCANIDARFDAELVKVRCKPTIGARVPDLVHM